MLKKIVSGGQTGADRAALDAALENDFPIGGYCPRGRKAEDGPIDQRYFLDEIEGGYAERTKKNVDESDGTVIFFKRVLQGGSGRTLEFCVEAGKPHELIDVDLVRIEHASRKVKNFIAAYGLQVVNVAGPRSSTCPAMYAYVKQVISMVLKAG